MSRNRRQIRGSRLLPGCVRAKTLREVNGDNICWGLYGDGYDTPSDRPIDACRDCAAFERNWNDWFYSRVETNEKP